MKKLTTVVAALVLFLSATAFTPDPGKSPLSSLFKVANVKTVSVAEVNRSVTSAFNKKYANAENVNWSEAEGFFFASFELNEGGYAVAYEETGLLLAVSRQVEMTQLPMAAEEAIKERYATGYTIPGAVTEIVFQGETNYYFTIESKTAYQQVKCSPDGNITLGKRIKKKVLVGKVY